MEIKLISITENPEHLISYIARVSNPDNQDNPQYDKLIKYLIKNSHFSPFEHAFMTVEIKTSRAIAAQLLRHRSFTFQEFSQRYSEVTEFEPIELRRQATKNRQSSLETFDPVLVETANDDYLGSHLVAEVLQFAKTAYKELVLAGVAKEVARMVLPLTTQTTLYMSGSIRSWIHYIELRDTDHVQKEHRMITQEIRGLFNAYLPTVALALTQIAKEKADKDFLHKLLTDGYISIDNGKLQLQEGLYENKAT